MDDGKKALDPTIIASQMVRARESVCPIGKRFKFSVRRPTEMDLVRMRGPGGEVEVNLQCLQTCVFGWSGVLESDLVEGGAGDEYPFNPVIWMQFIADRADLWEPLAKHIRDQVEGHAKRLEQLGKN